MKFQGQFISLVAWVKTGKLRASPGPSPGFRPEFLALRGSLHTTMTLYQHNLVRGCAWWNPTSRNLKFFHWGWWWIQKNSFWLASLVTNALQPDVFLTRLIVNRILLNNFYFKFSREVLIWRNTKAKYHPKEFFNKCRYSDFWICLLNRAHHIITIILEKDIKTSIFMQFCFFLLYIFTVSVINQKTLMRPEIDLKKKHSSIEEKDY